VAIIRLSKSPSWGLVVVCISLGRLIQKTSFRTFAEVPIYVKCCLEDGSVAYIPILTLGKICRRNKGSTIAATIASADVPDNLKVLE
jgi:hypothetical protein